MVTLPPSKAVAAAEMVYRLSVADLEGHLPRSYLLARTLVHLGYDAFVVESSSFPIYLEDEEGQGWQFDLSDHEQLTFCSVLKTPPAAVIEFYDLPWDDLDAMAQLLISDNRT